MVLQFALVCHLLIVAADMPPRSGGHQQERKRRLEREGELERRTPPVFIAPLLARPAGDKPELSPLAWSLLEKWSWGHISSPMVQELADAVKKHFASSDSDIDKLASLGAHGEQPQHINRDLRIFLKDIDVPEGYAISVPFSVKVGASFEVVWCDCEILLPHEWFASLAKKHPDILRLDRVSAGILECS